VISELVDHEMVRQNLPLTGVTLDSG
jgi:hypothetical protein